MRGILLRRSQSSLYRSYARCLLAVLIGILAISCNAITPDGQALAPSRLSAGSLQPSQTTPNPSSAAARKLAPVRQPVATGPLRVSSENPRYFTDGKGAVIYLTGSHTWDNRQDLGTHPFDFSRYLALLQQYNHNFVRFYVWEQPKGLTTSPDPTEPLATLTPEIFARTGPGTAADGGLKFDLSQYNQAFFDRLRQRVSDARDHGIYMSVMLFDGWSVEQKAGGSNPWVYHPFNKNNNVNGINGDPNNDRSGAETHTLVSIKNATVTRLQEAYVRKVIDTVNDLDNVLYEISNESNADADSVNWQYHMINYIKSYEATKAKQHPVGMTVPYPDGSNDTLFNSPADWISPNGGDGYMDDPPPASGDKVIISDTDHLWGIGGDRSWAWKSFTRGLNVIYMDPWDGEFIPVDANPDLRLNMGYILSFANCMGIAKMTPHGELASSTFALANLAKSGSEFLIYFPYGGTGWVDLTGTPGNFTYLWFDPQTAYLSDGTSFSGGVKKSFRPPFSGDAVLYIHQISTTTPIPGLNNKIFIPVTNKNSRTVVQPVCFQ